MNTMDLERGERPVERGQLEQPFRIPGHLAIERDAPVHDLGGELIDLGSDLVIQRLDHLPERCPGVEHEERRHIVDIELRRAPRAERTAPPGPAAGFRSRYGPVSRAAGALGSDGPEAACSSLPGVLVGDLQLVDPVPRAVRGRGLLHIGASGLKRGHGQVEHHRARSSPARSSAPQGRRCRRPGSRSWSHP